MNAFKEMTLKHKSSFLFPVILFCLSAIVPLQAATYTVKAGGGGNYATIAACAAVATAGDTCQIYAGSYAGWTQSANGSAGNPITFTANSGDTVTVTGGISISGRSYITISHLALQGTIQGNSATNHCIIDHNTSTAALFSIPYITTQAGGAAYTSTDNVISNNTVRIAGHSGVITLSVYGDRNRIENNNIGGSGDDCMNVGGKNVVIRGNYCHDLDGTGSGGGNHIDFVQNIGGAAPTLTQSLIEHNVEQNCTNDGGNCHFVISRTNGGSGSVGTSDNLIIRYNFAQNLNGMAFDMGGVGDVVTNPHIYNNTVALEQIDTDPGGGAIFYSDSCSPCVAGVILNNIFYNTEVGSTSRSPIAGQNAGDTGKQDGNLTYTAGYSGGFGSPYSSEPTYASLHSINPLFANYPTGGTLEATSPAIGAGVALTTASVSGSNSASLTVADARFFQSGWAGTQADWIRIGASTTVQISSINYNTNVITLAGPASWTSGASVYLYKDSSGNVVLNAANPDLGAYPNQSVGANNPTPPTNLAATVQ